MTRISQLPDIPEIIFIAVVMILALDVAIELNNPPAVIVWIIGLVMFLTSSMFGFPIEWFYITMVFDAVLLGAGAAIRMGDGRGV